MSGDLERRIDRRTLLVRAGRAGVAVGAGPAVFATSAKASRSRRSAGTLKVGVEASFVIPAMQSVVSDFTKLTGINVELSVAGGAGGDQVASLTPQFAS